MENVEIMKKEVKKTKKAKKVEIKPEMSAKQVYMLHRNEARKAAHLPEVYSQEDIAAAK